MKGEMRIKIDSFSDVITNSSTTIYVMTHGKSIKLLEELVDEILKTSGSKNKAKDLFDFRIELDANFLNNRVYDAMCEEGIITEEEVETLNALIKKDSPSTTAWKKYNEEKVVLVKSKINNNEFDMDRGDSQREDELVMVPKNSSANVINVSRKMRQIFTIEESYDG